MTVAIGFHIVYMHEFKEENLMTIWKNQLIVLKTGIYRLKNQVFITAIIIEINLRVTK